MLGKLFGSNARVKILKLFISHPDKKFYIRQIARDLNLQLNSVRRELENLEDFGLLISNPGDSKEAANEQPPSILENLWPNDDHKSKKTKKIEENPKSDRKYFKVDTNFIIYKEIKELVIRAQILYEKDFVEKLKKLGKTKLVVLTGFFVNEVRPVDLLVVGNINKIKLHKLIKELESELERELNFTLMDTKEYKYRRDITDIFLYDILENKHIKVIDEFKND